MAENPAVHDFATIRPGNDHDVFLVLFRFANQFMINKGVLSKAESEDWHGE
ncbi:hypothetical protein [Celeribacter indicus]|uniref:hypothetical protein n=1 Tax=Celeribacter indicus TaxID=1208324 RepID=UPI00130E2019|nr:hypothetical protein [Celeribacter indicus]